MTTRASMLLVLAMLSGCSAAAVAADNLNGPSFPERAVRLVVPKAPGGPVDVMARLVASKLASAWGKPVIVENRAGAGGAIGSAEIAQAVPDGHSLLFTDVTSQVMVPLLMTPRPYGAKDFAPISLVARTLMVLVANAQLPVRSIDELVAYAKARPGTLNFSSAGAGGFAHLTTEVLANRLGMTMEHILYKGGAPALMAVATGEVDIGVTDLASATPLIQAGKIRAIAQLGLGRSPQLPSLPTVSEAGVAGFEGVYWIGLLAPPGTPASIVDKLSHDINSALQAPDLVDRAKTFGVDLVGSTPSEFRITLNGDEQKWAGVIKDNHIKSE